MELNIQMNGEVQHARRQAKAMVFRLSLFYEHMFVIGYDVLLLLRKKYYFEYIKLMFMGMNEVVTLYLLSSSQ